MKRTHVSCLAMLCALALAVSARAEPPKPESLDLGGGVSMELVPIPAGRFLMGSPGDPDGVKQTLPESPQHEVTISRPFLMGKCLVTQEQFTAVMGPWRFSEKLGIGDRLPAHSFSWKHAAEFCQKLSERTGRTVRIPTEAEWEYACRAGTTTKYFCGDDAKGLDEYAWLNTNSGGVLKAVGLKKPNPWGLYDINGLLCEYCSDSFSPDAYTNEAEVDPAGPPFSPGGGHVLRSGVFNMGGTNWARSACRLYDTNASGNHGLRVVVELPGAPPLPGTAPTEPPAAPAGPPPEVKVRDLPHTTLDLGGDVKLEMVQLPAGRFTIGVPLAEPGRRAGERPQREVTLSRPFLMGTCELTQAQYQAVMGEGKKFQFPGPTHPADSLSRKEAEAFCTKLSAKLGKTVRLPTEAEWEYACRAGTRTAFCYGDGRADLGAFAWFAGNADGGTHPVGTKRPNAFGLYDMHGNVWEFCSDQFQLDTYAKMTDAVDPKGPAESGWYTNRSMRGGGFDCPARDCRSGRRGMIRDVYGMPAFGMRLVMEIDGGDPSDAPVPAAPATPAAPAASPQAAPAEPAAGRATAPAATTESANTPRLSLDLGGDVKLELVLIPAGKFTMGLPEDVRQAHPYPSIVGAPLHEVTITKPFYMGIYEVTYGQYWAVMGKENCPYERAARKNPKILKTRMKGPEYPVDFVLPQDALDFCQKASKLTGKTVRLPTEAEWEYACRAGTTTRFSFGNDMTRAKEYGWWKENTQDGVNRPAKVGQLKPNPWGLYDMHGNMCEYCADTYLTDDFPKGPAVDPYFPPTRKPLVLIIRGGEYNVGLWDSTRRYGVYWTGNTHGFRVVVDAAPGGGERPAPVPADQPATPTAGRPSASCMALLASPATGCMTATVLPR